MRLFLFLNRCAVSLLLCIVASITYANSNVTVLTSKHFSSVQTQATKLAEHYGKSHVLIVYDIDNTLLAMNQNLGSDQWFSWQVHLLTSKPNSNALVAKSFQGLLAAQGLLFELSHMHLTEKVIPSIVKSLHDQGYPMVVLTSRGHDFDHVTLKALNDNQLNFDHYFNVNVANSPYYPYSIDHLHADGLNQKDLSMLSTKSPRKVVFEEGVLFGAGQNKGILLKTLLAHSKDQIKAVVFIDDSQNNIDQFDQIIKQGDLAVIAIRYSGEDGAVKAFQASDKQKVTLQWQKLTQTLNEVLKLS
ncbi:DUF2608 domain-containing protein [Thiotrichales bacterium 19S3-7]|nr:DUF2608 domain-containing protein [Thiotrichales bacterium 19S3-7]MCF6800556.1 DUF2608 domain-containing protein [Thiotrichales bacterium 19S3-11]